jgi:hypothetical protein
MRKSFIVIAFLFVILGIVFAVLPMGTLALAPVGLAILFSILAFIKSEPTEKALPKWLLIISVITLVVVVGKVLLIKDELAKDTQFEQKKIESKKEDMKDLEDLD